MKAITLTQPWATLVAIGAKKIETRSWQTHYRGVLAIHAAKTMPKSARSLCYEIPFSRCLHEGLTISDEQALLLDEQLPRGAVIAVGEIIGCRMILPHAMQYLGLKGEWVKIPPPVPEWNFGDYSPGRFAWMLANVRALPEPIPAKGALGLWEWTPPEGFTLEP